MNGTIDIEGLKKTFADVVAVADLHLQVRKGEMVGLIGPDGAGKTTTMRILCGLLLADSGRCLVGGLDAAREVRQIRQFVGYMPQRFSLYPDLTVAENLRFFSDLFRVSRQQREQRLQRLLEFSRLGPFAQRQAQALSGGMKQKLALSCTLIHTPEILLLDEPTTGVDPVSRREFWDILADLRREGVTILVSTPYMDEAARCDRVTFVHKGRVLLDTVPAQIPSFHRGTLLEVRGPNMVTLAARLRASGRFGTVQVFGDRLHIGGDSDERTLTGHMHTLLNEAERAAMTIKAIPAGIEDVFVQLLD